MQKLDESKRRAILDAAAELFATRAFHEVRLDDVAAAARIGKGTVYIYFKSKEDLFGSMIRDGFGQLVQRLDEQLAADESAGAWKRIETIITELAGFALKHPHTFEVMRAGASASAEREVRNSRKSLGKLAEKIIRQGNKSGELHDPHPELTGQMLPASVRGVIVHGPDNLKPADIAEHLLRILKAGIGKKR